MNDYTALSELTKNIEHMNTLIIFISINILISIFQIFSSFILKSKDKSIHSYKEKETIRIQKLEECYNKLEGLTYFDGRVKNHLFLKGISDVDHYVTKNKLYFDKKYIQIINDMNDYFRTVLTDYRKKSYELEGELFTKYSNRFNK